MLTPSSISAASRRIASSVNALIPLPLSAAKIVRSRWTSTLIVTVVVPSAIVRASLPFVDSSLFHYLVVEAIRGTDSFPGIVWNWGCHFGEAMYQKGIAMSLIDFTTPARKTFPRQRHRSHHTDGADDRRDGLRVDD